MSLVNNKPQYSKEFKKEAVDLALNGSISIVQTAKDLGLKTKQFEYDLKLSNIFNKHVYAYSVNSNMMSITNINEIRGRELMFSIYCRL